MMNFRRIAVWFVLFALLAHAAGDVSAAPFQAPSVCDAQSLIADMADHSDSPVTSVCDLQRALKLPHGAPVSSLPDGESAYQATLPPSFTLSLQGLHFLHAAPLASLETVSISVDAEISVGMWIPFSSPGCLLSHQIAPHAPPALS